MSALSGFRPLRHLDLKISCIGQVVDRHAEPTRRHLLDRAAARVAVGVKLVARRVLAAFTGVAARADAVHGDRQRLVRLAANRPERYRSGSETLRYFAGWLHLVQGDRFGWVYLEFKESPNRGEPTCLVIRQPGVLSEHGCIVAVHRILQERDGERVVHVVLTVCAPLVEAGDVKRQFCGQSLLWIGAIKSLDAILSNLFQADTFYLGWRPCKELIYELLGQSKSFKNLSSVVAGQG